MDCSDDELILIKGTKARTASSIILRGQPRFSSLSHFSLYSVFCCVYSLVRNTLIYSCPLSWSSLFSLALKTIFLISIYLFTVPIFSYLLDLYFTTFFCIIFCLFLFYSYPFSLILFQTGFPFSFSPLSFFFLLILISPHLAFFFPLSLSFIFVSSSFSSFFPFLFHPASFVLCSFLILSFFQTSLFLDTSSGLSWE